MSASFLHDLVSCLSAPAVALSAADGQIRTGGIQGLLLHDIRMLSRLEVFVDEASPVLVGSSAPTAASATFVGLLPEAGPDHVLALERTRAVRGDGLTERLTVRTIAPEPTTVVLGVRAASDLASMSDIRQDVEVPLVSPTLAGNVVEWTNGESRVALSFPAATEVTLEGNEARLVWQLEVPAGGSVSIELDITGTAGVSAGFEPAVAPWSRATVTAADRDLGRLVDRSLDDLEALVLADAGDPFLAAGSPWFFTLFGRDSIWAARMLLPLGTELARGTLATLARRQGTREDQTTGEQPGKILHEVRGTPVRLSEENALPPLYYGTIDATALWVSLLYDAWRWGMAADEFVPALRGALGWITGPADTDGDGFLEYIDHTGKGLSNQGWKDSHDGVQSPTGELAKAPIALCEAQAYAYEAVVKGAALLEALGQPGVDSLRSWAAGMRDRFRSAFWVSDERGPFPAIALDGDKRPVPTVTSNLGHLLGTGLLDDAEIAHVAERLRGRDMDTGRGLRTMSSTATGFNPLGYHTGSIWPHDTAIAVTGLVRDNHALTAAGLANGIVSVARAFDDRIPELYGGTSAFDGEPLLVYPPSCRPQAWSAAGVIAMVAAALGLDPDVPNGVLRVSPSPAFSSWWPLRVVGLHVAGHRLDVTVDAHANVDVSTDADVRIEIG